MISAMEFQLCKLYLAAVSTAKDMKNKAVRTFDNTLVKFDAWFVVLLAVLMTIAFLVATGLAVWCVVSQKKKFSGKWKWSKKGVSVSAECV